MVAYKTDPLGLNDTVTPTSTNSSSAATSNHNNKRSFRHLAGRLTVKKNKNRGTTSTAHNASTARPIQQQNAVSTDYVMPSAETNELDQVHPPTLMKNDPLIIQPPTDEPETIETIVATHKTTATNDDTINSSNAAFATTLELSERNQEFDDNASISNQPINKIPKFLQRFSRCCPRHDEIAANEKVLVCDCIFLFIVCFCCDCMSFHRLTSFHLFFLPFQMTVFASFLVFTIAQFVLAFAANSLSLLGDTSAQIVDCIDYSLNFVAERRKLRFDKLYQDPYPNLTRERAFQLRQRAKRKAILFWEVVPPMISVICLVGVTTYVLQDSTRTLIQDFTTKPKSQQDSVNLTLVLTLQLVNLAIDILNFTCFAKIHHLRGFETVHQLRLTTAPITMDGTNSKTVNNKEDAIEEGFTLNNQDEAEVQAVITQETLCTKGCCAEVDEIVKNEEVNLTNNNNSNDNNAVVPNVAADIVPDQQDCCADHLDHANLNMCSAYTVRKKDELRYRRRFMDQHHTLAQLLLFYSIPHNSTSWQTP